MSDEILIHTTAKYTQAALIQDEQVREIDMSPIEPSLSVGDIIYAKIVRIMSPMRMAFVEIGGSRTALLHFADVHLPEGRGHTDPAQFLRVGQLLLVQITKLPRGEKGAVVSTGIQLVGAMVIYQPMGKGISVSKSITEEAERKRLWTILSKTEHAGAGMVRSLAVHQQAEVILNEWQALLGQWAAIEEKIKNLKKPTLVRAEYGLACTFVREHVSTELTAIYVDNKECYQQLSEYLTEMLPGWLPHLKKINQKNSPWRTYQLDKIIKESLHSKITLPSGGFILVEQTETMMVVDVNTGQFVSAKQGTDIIYQTNMEAARAIVQHIRLCNLSGTIVIDFIRMKNPEQQEQIMKLLNEALSQDSAYSKVYGFSPIGLVEMSRQRKGNSWTELYKNE